MKFRLIYQYFLALALVVSIAIVAVVNWVNNQAAVVVLGATAETAALYLQAGIQPNVQSLAGDSKLSSEDQAALDRIVARNATHGAFNVIKLWSPSGRLVFAPQGESAKGPPLREIRQAVSGRVVGALPDLDDEGHRHQRALGRRFYEIYFPLYDEVSGEVIAIGEAYQDADTVGAALFNAAYDNWVVMAVGGAGLAFILGLIVYRGSRTIDRQVETLRANLLRQEAMQRQNTKLRDRVAKATLNVARIDEIAQRRIGADLHDGPGQLLSFMAMRMDQLEAAVMERGRQSSERLTELVTDIRDAATQATREIRRIALGLVAPHLEGVQTLDGQIRAVAREHERLTGTAVAIGIDDDVPPVSGHVAGVLGRIAQEALTNAWKHAEGRGQEITLSRQGDHVTLRIRNKSADRQLDPTIGNKGAGLGIIGMKFRAESLGGTLAFENLSTETIVVCSVPVEVSD